MKKSNRPLDHILHELRERAKELNCLYQVQELINTPDISVDQVCNGIIKSIPPGWQYPEICQARIRLDQQIFQSEGFVESPWTQHQDIVLQDIPIGQISVCYTEECAEEDEGPFLKEERKLINSIAELLNMFLLHQQLKQVFEKQHQIEERKPGWSVILDLLSRTDPPLLLRIARKMVHYLIWESVEGARELLINFTPAYRYESELLDVNQPYQIDPSNETVAFVEEIFELAAKHKSEEKILEKIQQWFKEDQSGFLPHTLVHPNSSLHQIKSAMTRYQNLSAHGLELSPSREQSARTALLRRTLCDRLQYVNIGKKYISINQIHNILQNTIHLAGSHGTVGGKSAGLILAHSILKKTASSRPILEGIKIPKTWYITSDTIFDFLSYNGIEDIIEHKYQTIDQIRQEYPYIVHIFKHSSLPPEIVKDLRIAFDDFGDTPLIVRSSSLLEDRTGMAFAGKYKSLFIANQGTPEERLNALIEAITEVYASMFGPDPIEYRIEHGLIDQHEEMGILIQEVIGTRIGKYHLPIFAGVALGSNQFPWSNRIQPEDGLIRLVPGLGTRAVDRLKDDYSVLVAPGQRGIRPNVTTREIQYYSPKQVDVLNLETETFETIDFLQLIKEYPTEFPDINKIISYVAENHIRRPVGVGVDPNKGDIVVTFENLFSQTPFLEQIHTILIELQRILGYPVDIEFAHDGKHLYLLQCRSQNFTQAIKPANIPTNIPPDQKFFCTHDFITNGTIKNITHILYVDPKAYSQLEEYDDLVEVGRVVSQLNNLLPRRQFILLGPGRWGSRGDIKLGVRVTFADIRNSAMLIEVAFPDSKSPPDPSYGTHFFQDLAEISIRYLSLDPNHSDTFLNQNLLSPANNSLIELLPEASHFANVIRVIHIPEVTNFECLNIYMNADQNTAIAFLENNMKSVKNRKGGKQPTIN